MKPYLRRFPSKGKLGPASREGTINQKAIPAAGGRRGEEGEARRNDSPRSVPPRNTLARVILAEITTKRGQSENEKDEGGLDAEKEGSGES